MITATVTLELLVLIPLAGSTAWSATPAASGANDPQLPPAVLHFCAAHCATWYLTDDHKAYAGVPGYPGIGVDGLGVAIASFTRDSVVLNRSDPPNPWFPNGLKAVITGQISPDGNRLANGKIRWVFGQSGIQDVAITWGSALDSIPGEDPPSPQKQVEDAYRTVDTIMASAYATYTKDHPERPVREENPLERLRRLEDEKQAARVYCANNQMPKCPGLNAVMDELGDAIEEEHVWNDQMTELHERRVALAPQCRAGKTDACTERDRIFAQLCANGTRFLGDPPCPSE